MQVADDEDKERHGDRGSPLDWCVAVVEGRASFDHRSDLRWSVCRFAPSAPTRGYDEPTNTVALALGSRSQPIAVDADVPQRVQMEKGRKGVHGVVLLSSIVRLREKAINGGGGRGA